MSIVYVIILIGVLIFVHELGHFLVAKAFNVKVLEFAIGMGPKFASFKKGETEYSLRILPLGGYVRMLGFDLSEVEQLDPAERERALMTKPIWQRSLVTLAGPGANIVLPILIYFFATLGQTTTPPPVVGEVFAGSPAQEAGLEAGDKIVALDGEPIDYWHEMLETVSASYDRTVELTYERAGETTTVEVQPERKTSTDFLGLRSETYGLIGIHLGTSDPTIGIPSEQSPAYQAGLRNFDKVLTIDGEPITRFDELTSAVRASGGEPLELVVLRRVPLETDYGRFYAQEVETLTVTPVQHNGAAGEPEWTLGLDRAEMYLAKVEEGSPAWEAGLRTGDKITALEGDPYSNWAVLNRRIQNTINELIVARQEAGEPTDDLAPSFELTYERDGVARTTTLEPAVIKFTDATNTERYRVSIGWGHLPGRTYPEDIAFPLLPRLAYSIESGVEQTTELVGMMVMGIVRMAQGRVSLDSLGGPIMIGELAAEAGKAGWGPFLRMMALISINLAIINLLPIPVLDGGHLLLYALEAIKRGPLSFRTRQIAAYIGFVLIVFLMVLAFKNDIERNWDRIAEYINEV